MNQITKFSFTVLIIMSSFSCNAQTNQKAAKSDASTTIEAYYFHFTGRCVTCKTVEAEAKASLESLYGEKVRFQSINLDDALGKAKAEKLKVSGQTLLVVKGETRINLTNEGFMYARSNPEKFKSIIKEKVDPLL